MLNKTPDQYIAGFEDARIAFFFFTGGALASIVSFVFAVRAALFLGAGLLILGTCVLLASPPIWVRSPALWRLSVLAALATAAAGAWMMIAQ